MDDTDPRELPRMHRPDAHMMDSHEHAKHQIEDTLDAGLSVQDLEAAHSRLVGSSETIECAESGFTPSYRAPAREVPEWDHETPDGSLHPGQVIGDFEIIRILGEGSLARVYLARQLSLGRLVALKVSATRSAEARTLAILEHEHIVRLFSESMDPKHGLRLLCMQYVPGISLQNLIRGLRDVERGNWNGRLVLEAVDALGPHPGAIDPAALRDRELLERSDWIEAVCWTGVRLAEALSYAHGRGVLHRDIKPANILVNPYGRPLLADFNLASDLSRDDDVEIFGGSLAYMAPEHLQAFQSHVSSRIDEVNELSDLYSLGVVIYELLLGLRPFREDAGAQHGVARLQSLVAGRMRGAPTVWADEFEVPPVLAYALRRCLDPDPARRHDSAAELARDLDSCRELRRIERELPIGRLTSTALRRPAVMLAIASFLPHLLGSAINISYNALQIVDNLTMDQQARFRILVLAYNAVAYPLCVGKAYRMALPVFRTRKAIHGSRPIGEHVVTEARQGVLEWPLRIAGLACIGWLPGGILFPWILDMFSDNTAPISPGVYGHFIASFWISGLIALTYSYFGVEVIAIRVMYPQLWIDGRGVRATMAAELGRRESRQAVFQLLASLIPLSGAVLLIGLGPEDMSRIFRTLVGALIVIGMSGVGLTHSAARLLTRSLTVLADTDRRSPT